MYIFLRSSLPHAHSSLPLYFTVATVAAGLALARPAAAQTTLWYNGDHNSADSQSGSGVLNNDSTLGGDVGSIYDNFVVTDPTGWNISSIWSNDFVYGSVYSGPATQAQWSIRSGMSVGNGGTVLYSGVSSATQTDTGLLFNSASIYQTTVSGLNIDLSAGTYWLQVTPVVSSGSEIWYNAGTNGLNAIGTPQGQDGNAFFNDPAGYNYTDTSVSSGPQHHDFSLGVAGTVDPSPAPEPSQFAALGFSALGLGGLLARARQSRKEAA